MSNSSGVPSSKAGTMRNMYGVLTLRRLSAWIASGLVVITGLSVLVGRGGRTEEVGSPLAKEGAEFSG